MTVAPGFVATRIFFAPFYPHLCPSGRKAGTEEPNMPMTCETTIQGETAVFTLSGTIDEEGAAALKKQFNALPLSQIKELVIDLADISHIGSSGIGKLLLFYKNMAAHQGTIRLTRVPQPIHDLFTELRLDTLFSMSTSR